MSSISKKHLPRGEDSLADLEAIEVTLENGTVRRFNIAAELSPLPTSPTELVREAENTIARLAFWGYQTERAKSAAIRAEAMADKAWALAYDRERQHIQKFTEVEIATENNIKHRIIQEGTLEITNSHVRGAWKRYGALRSLTTALEHRSHLIRLLIRRDSDAKAFGA